MPAIHSKEERESLRVNPTFAQVCPTSTKEAGDNKLESVSMYQTIDVLCEGQIEGLCDRHGDLIRITSNSTKNEDGFKAIYLNDVPVKNTDSNTLNYNRVFADFRIGSEKQRALSKFNNPALSFSNAVQTLNLGTSLPGLAGAVSDVDPKNLSAGSFIALAIANMALSKSQKEARKFIVTGEDDPQKNLSLTWEYAHSGGAFHLAGNFIYGIHNLDTVSQVKTAEKDSVVSVMHTITNDSVDWVQVDMAVAALMFSNDSGDQLASTVNYIIKTGYVDDEITVKQGGSVMYMIGGIHGRSSSGYTRSHNVILPPAVPADRRDRFIKIFRIDKELGPKNVKISKSLSVAAISEIVEQNLTYPNSALMGMLFDARAFAQPPTRRFDAKLTRVLVPTNYDTVSREYKGNWDGNFATKKKWTDNPAWAFYDLATNERYGIGKFGFKSQFIDKWNLYSVAKYCDQLVPTNNSGKYVSASFECESGGVVVTIDDSGVNRVGKNVLFERFPEGGEVCLFNTKDASGTDLDKSFKRLVFERAYSAGNIFTFKIVKVPDVENVFKTYPSIQTSFLEHQKDRLEGALSYVIGYLTNQQNSTSSFVTAYMEGEPLDLGVTQGEATVQFSGFLPLLEPRFSCNLYLDKRQNAFNALNDIAALFRGMIYWSSGYIFTSNDQAREAVMLFTNANVSDGSFIYSGSSLTSRATVITVRYNDSNDSFKAKVEYMEDAAGIREFGIIEKDIVALGVTSKSQAHRLAKWMLYTTQTETDTVQFSTGQEGSYLRPGDVVKIQDKLKSLKRYGGRIKDIDYAARSVTLDEGIDQDIVNQKITFIVPKLNSTVRELNKTAAAKLKIGVENQEVSDGISMSEIDSTREPQIKQFTISSVSETNVISVTETSDSDFNLIKKGFIWSVQNTASAYEIEEVEYRVLSVVEQSFNQYQITGMMYNRSKFAAIDESKNLERTQQSKTSLIEVGSITSLPSGSESLQSYGNDPLVDVVPIYTNEGVSLIPDFNARFINNHGELNESEIDTYMKLDFSQLAVDNKVSAENTGGYVVDVYKDSGDKVRFTLDGHDQTEATVLIGSQKESHNLTVEIYRYDATKKINSGAPAP